LRFYNIYEIFQYGAITDISKFLNLVICLIIKSIMYSVPYLFFINFKNQDLLAKFLQIAATSIFCYDFSLI